MPQVYLNKKGVFLKMKDKVVVITGGASGLGARLARKFSEKEAKVVLLDVSNENLATISARLPHENFTYQTDVSSSENVEATFKTIYSEVGNVDMLINCAGIGRFDLAEKIPTKFVDGMIDINLKGTIFCTQQVLGAMKEKNAGQIINIISMSGKRAKHSEAIYSASKFGVTGFTQGVAIELEGTAVKIMGIYMGNMATELWKGEKPKDLDTYIDPEDMADIIIHNAEYRPNLSVEEVVVKNTQEG